MRHLLPASSRRPTALTAVLLSLIACLLGVLGATACAAVAEEVQLVPFVVGGQESSISQYPWQVFVFLPSEEDRVRRLDPDPDDDPDRRSLRRSRGHHHDLPSGSRDDHGGYLEREPIRAPAAEKRSVASIRIHPYYTPPPNIKDDAAVLTLTEPLTLSSSRHRRYRSWRQARHRRRGPR